MNRRPGSQPPLTSVVDQALPGIGHRYELRPVDGGRAVVVVHHSGRRDLYAFAAGASEPQAVVILTDTEARTLGAILGGAYFKPAVVEEIEAVIGGLLIDWITLDAEARGVGRTIGELEIRQRTGITIAAIMRDSVPHIAPDPNERLQAGDQVVVIGRQEDLPRFLHHVVDGVGDALVAIGGAFLAAGLFGRLGRRIGLPTIPFFMVAGILFGPHTPGLVLVEHPEQLELLAALGLILLLLHLGLEFSLGDLLDGGRRLLVAGGTYLALNVGGGLAFGVALGWGTGEAFVIAGALGISSSAIVTKLLIELRRLANPESRTILGVAVVQDIFVALYLALLQPALGDATGTADAVLEFLTAFGFLLALAATARWGASAAGRLVGAPDDELLTVCFVGLAVLVAGIAAKLGVSEAIGAFGVGLVLAETSVAERMERLVLPLRDAFAAAFFFAIGLSIDPGDAGRVAGPVLGAVVLSLMLNLVAGIAIARQAGAGRVPAANIALTLLGRGELSLILATLAVSAGLDHRLGPFIALYVLVLAVAGPLLAAQSRRLAEWLPGRLEPAAGAR